MKKITLLIAVLTISLNYGQVNLLTNGDFETGDLSGWLGYNRSIAIENTIAYGTYVFPGGYGDATPLAAPITHAACMKFGDTDLFQEITVVSESQYTVKFFFRPSFNTFFDSRVRNRTGDVAGSFLDLTPIVPDTGTNAGDATKYRCKPDAASNPTLDWEEASYSFITPAGVTKVRFQNYSNNTAALFMDEVSIVFDSTVSIEETLIESDFKAYPNPANDVINISAAKSINKIEIYNLLGQQVVSKNVDATNDTIDVSQLTNGIYTLKTFIGGAIGIQKFIKE
jgi:hypothetical protein